MSEERMTVETVDICTCGIVMHQADADDYDTLGSISGTCCPDCGNEKFQTVAELQAELDKLKEEQKRFRHKCTCKSNSPPYKCTCGQGITGDLFYYMHKWEDDKCVWCGYVLPDQALTNGKDK